MVNIGAPPPNEKPKNHLSPINPGTAPNAEYNFDNRFVVSCCTFQAETHRIIEPLLSTVSVLCEAICFTNGRYFGAMLKTMLSWTDVTTNVLSAKTRDASRPRLIRTTSISWTLLLSSVTLHNEKTQVLSGTRSRIQRRRIRNITD